nr:MT-A70 family methyltransferase [Sinorhizobium meliloti]
MVTDWFFAPLLPLHYELIVIDPPWGFDLYSKEGAKKSALAKYELMKDAEVRTLPVGKLASMDCLLYCWATAPQLPLAIECVKAWGFEYKSVLVWRKTTPAGKIRMGTGYRVRTTGEVVVVATLGNPKQAAIPQTIFDGIAREHSRKPDEFYALCDRVMPHARRADVFAREQRTGWHAFGNEVTKFNEVAA